MQPFGHNTWARIGGAVPPPTFRNELGSHLTQCRLAEGLRTFAPSGIVDFLYFFFDDAAAALTSTRCNFFDDDSRDSTATTSRCFLDAVIH